MRLNANTRLCSAGLVCALFQPNTRTDLQHRQLRQVKMHGQIGRRSV